MAVERDGLCDQSRDITFVTCVHLHGGRRVTDHRSGVMHRCGHVAQNDLRTLCRKADGGCPANA